MSVSQSRAAMGMWMAIGAGMGAAIGVPTGNVAQWIGIGIGMGTAVGAGLTRLRSGKPADRN